MNESNESDSRWGHQSGTPAERTARERNAILSRWPIVLAWAAAGLACGCFYAVFGTPQFRSDAIVQLEEKLSKGANEFDELTGGTAMETPADAEIEIMRSRTLLGSVVKQLSLDVEAAPRWFPVFGSALARRWKSRDLAPPVLGLSRFAWGGERISLRALTVPLQYESAELRLVAEGDGRYVLYTRDGVQLLKGQVGKRARGAGFEVSVDELYARPGTQFVVRKLAVDDAVEEIKSRLIAREKGRKTGIIRLELTGRDPVRVTKTLDALAVAYVRQNEERRSEVARRTLEFVDSQLPEIKGRLEGAEQALNKYRSRYGSVDVSLEARAAIDRAVDLEKAKTELQLHEAEVHERFTDDSPSAATVREKRRQLVGEQENIERRMKVLPDQDLHSVRLTRDVSVANELYVLLLGKAQELRISKSGAIGNVRVVDHALEPRKKYAPSTLLSALVGLIAGSALGVGVARRARPARPGERDHDAIERAVGAPVFTAIPYSEVQSVARRRQRKAKAVARPLAAIHPQDAAVEGVRSLRTGLYLGFEQQADRIISIGGPCSDVGKSFIAANLACVFADAGEKVLLIDGDLRKGTLHEHFGVEASPGLTEILQGQGELVAAVRYGAAQGVDLLPSGEPVVNSSELLMGPTFAELLA
ncbi:MAG TPA: GNVR domain-containing protein, partial [Anaeromyxobacteraceae bacterium]|nr:GNVR domain-containing protein [Anaeromyxobacteraceae bacterium]